MGWLDVCLSLLGALCVGYLWWLWMVCNEIANGRKR